MNIILCEELYHTYDSSLIKSIVTQHDLTLQSLITTKWNIFIEFKHEINDYTVLSVMNYFGLF